MTALIDGRRVTFTPCQYLIFMKLWNARGETVSKDQLLDACSSQAMSRVVDAYICDIRTALFQTKFRIYTRRSFGFNLARMA